MIIEDGTGTGKKAKVNDANELVVRAISEAEIEHASDEGNAFSWDSTDKNIDAGDTMLFIKNLSDDPLHFDRITVNGSNVICTWTILLGNATTTPSGTTVTGINLNPKFSGTAPDVNSLSDETAVADASVIDRVITPVTNTLQHRLTGVILNKGEFIQVNQVTASTSGSVILIAHFET